MILFYDRSGNGSSVTETAVIGTVMLHSTETFGSTADVLRFSTAIMNDQSTYTLFHVAKYNGTTRRRILNGVQGNWLSGFWDGMSGIAYHGEWLTQRSSSVHGSNWVRSTEQRNLYRSEGVTRGTTTGGSSSQLSINYGCRSEYSDWAVAEVIVYDTELSPAQYEQVEKVQVVM